MILTEQKYTNESRIYWHGSMEDSIHENSEKTCLFVTIKPEYAMCFANPIILDLAGTKDFGTLFMIRQSRPMNIFNVKSKNDERVLREIALELGFYLDNDYIKAMKEFDWIEFMGKPGREELITAIKERGYDGFFNYEIDTNESIGKIKGKMASIGLFNPISIGHTIKKSGKDILSFDAIKELHSFELCRLLDDVFISVKRGNNKSKTIADIFVMINKFLRYTTILEDDIDIMYDMVVSGKTPKSAYIQEAIKNNGEYHYGWDGQLTGKLW